MSTNRVAVAVPAAALSLALVAGCGGSKSASSATGSATKAGAAATSSSATDCPTSNTRSFAKTRFVTDVALSAGTFHRYIYKPYQAGTFKKGADGRVKALVKAGATAGLDYKLITNAKKNVKANPTLCKSIAAPLDKAENKLIDAKTKIAKGDTSGITDINSAMSGIESGSKKNKVDITETTDESKQKDG